MQKARVPRHSLGKHLPLSPPSGPGLLQAEVASSDFALIQRQLRPPVFINRAAGRRDGSWMRNTVQQPPSHVQLAFLRHPPVQEEEN